MKFMHGKCLAKCPAYGTVSVYLAMDITVDQTLILKLKKKLYHPNFLILLTPPTSLTSAQLLFSDSLVIWWQNWTLGALDLHCSYANDSNEKTVPLPRDWWVVSRVRD